MKGMRCARNGGPITITTAAGHGLTYGDWLCIAGKQYEVLQAGITTHLVVPVPWYRRLRRWLSCCWHNLKARAQRPWRAKGAGK